MRIRNWLGWMLRACRQLDPDQRFRSRTSLARAWPDGERVRPVHVSTIQRWETGQVPAPRETLERYEELLHLRTGQLTSVADYLLVLTHQLREARAGGDMQQLPDDSRRVGELLDRVTTSAVLSGAEWDELTGLLMRWPAALLPLKMWEATAQRLLLEMLASDGIAWAQRYEALARLFNHPAGGAAAIDACVSAAGLRNHQAMASTVAVLGVSDHRDSITAMVTQVRRPTNERALDGAIAGLAETVWRGRLEVPQRAEVMDALRPLSGSGDKLDARSALILHRLSAGNQQAHQPEPLPPPEDPRRQVTDRVVHRTIAKLIHPYSADPEELTELVHCLLFHSVPDSQIAAALTLSVTPYRTPLAGALRAELLSTTTLAGPARWSTTILAALRFVGGDPELRLTERIVLARGIPSETQRVAAFAIAHLGTDTPTNWWRTAIDQRLNIHAAGHGRPEDLEILRGLIYSAGVTGRRGALEQLRADPRSTFDVRAAAAWWLALPEHLLSSARS